MMLPERNARPPPKGWCPGAHRPMMSGDGLIVRVRPRLARLTAAQLRGLAEASLAHGNGIIDLTSRANLQLRGVGQAGTEPLLQHLAHLGLLDIDAAAEGRRNLLCAPGWIAGDVTHRLALTLSDRLADLPELPAKFGFAVDAGAGPILSDAPADIRIERGASGGLILRAEGRGLGTSVTEAEATDKAIALAHWFVQAGGSGRMAGFDAPLPAWAAPVEATAPRLPRLRPGLLPLGACLGVAFGQISADDLLRLPPVSVRVTPWRLLVLERLAAMPAANGFLTDPDDPLLAVDACPGAPMCSAATVATRDLARRLTPVPGRSLHVSGCAKGCARAKAADVTLVGRLGRFDVVRLGTAWDTPSHTGLSPEEVLAFDAL